MRILLGTVHVAVLVLCITSGHAATLMPLPPDRPGIVCRDETAEALFAMNAGSILKLDSNSVLRRFLLAYEHCAASFEYLSPVLPLGDAGWTVEPFEVTIDTYGRPDPRGCLTVRALLRDDTRVFCLNEQGALQLNAHVGSSLGER